MREEMREAMVLVRTAQAKDAIARLARLKAIHVTPHAPMTVAEREIGNGTPYDVAEALSASLNKTRWLLARVPEGDASAPTTTRDRMDLIDTLAASYARLEQERDRITRERDTLLQKQQALDALEGADIPLEGLWKPRSTRAFLTRDVRPVPDALATLPCAGGTLIIMPKDTSIPDAMEFSILNGMTGTREAALHHLQAELHALDRKLDRVKASMDGFRIHRQFLLESERELAFALLQAEAPLLFGQSTQTTIIRGYIPARRTEELATRLPDAVVETATVEDAPVLLRNPAAARPFEALLAMYAIPRYGELDPTVLMSIAFPLFFGFMLGDVGYGLLVVGLALVLPRLIRNSHAFSRILLMSGISSVLFGFAFAEFFGIEPYHPLLNRVEELNTLLLISIIIGIIHVNLGLLLGIINESRKEGLLYGLYMKGGWVLLQVAAVLIASAYGVSLPFIGILDVGKAAAFATLAAAIVLVVASERFKGAIELPIVFSHILSYTRLAAIGLASVSLAFVVNDVGRGMVASGGLLLVAGILLLIIGHAVNLALGMLGPFLHSLRLHYAEFFMKFYEGGGQPFKPFGEVGA